MERVGLIVRWSLAALAGAIVGYCVLVMVVVATAPDLRMRFLLVGPTETTTGIVIEKTINVVAKTGLPTPEREDELLEVNDVGPIVAEAIHQFFAEEHNLTVIDQLRAPGKVTWPEGPPAPKAPQGALPTLRAATDPDADSGSYWGPSGPQEMRGSPVRVRVPFVARDEGVAARLFDVSEGMTGVEFVFA